MTGPRDIRGALCAALAMAAMLPAATARAHVSEQGFVLLLPTDIYISAGAASVLLTVLLLSVTPDRLVPRILTPRLPGRPRRVRATARIATSCAAFALLAWLIWTGLTGTRDPLANPLPLTVWTVWWIGFITLQGLLGDLWRWVNPWTGPVALTRRALRLPPLLRLPAALGHWPAVAGFLAFAGFLLADPAPSDPARLAVAAAGYWLMTFAAVLAFGPRWLARGEGFTVLLRSYAQVGVFARYRARTALGLPGWQIFVRRAPAPGLAVFALVMLGSGSFDGLNETFWWLAILGINPLEFPGRSEVIVPTLAGLAATNLALITVFALSVWLGLRLARSALPLGRAFCLFAPSVLPIALGYHIAHYLPSFLVEIQYVLHALNDPFGSGADLLGLADSYVTTGFFNTPGTVRLIWLSQAGAVVAGHILAIVLAHGLAVRHFGTSRSAALSQAPLALFMVAYTLFGLWLLAAPRGA